MEVKQVIAVRKDLNMRKGKLAAQVAHASMKVLLDRMGNMYYVNGDVLCNEKSLHLRRDDPWYEWINGSFTKVVVYVEFEDAIYALENRCHFNGVSCAVITDAGRTEFHGEPTVTCIAIGPDWSDKIDEITGELPLL
jgi:peptidyl-tRNA hydrolase, PTH2 family